MSQRGRDWDTCFLSFVSFYIYINECFCVVLELLVLVALKRWLELEEFRFGSTKEPGDEDEHHRRRNVCLGARIQVRCCRAAVWSGDV
jgi:hypothetical protein